MKERALLLWRSSRARRVARVLLGLALAPVLALIVAAALTPLPAELRDGAPRSQSTRFLDRDGGLLREVRADDATRARWIALDDVGEITLKALLAAEDRRFHSHVGVDPIAVVRAAASSLWHRRVVSGASTLTMQLARLVKPHRRDLFGKLGEMALALRIEASLSKERILEEYLNRAPFGPGLRGIEASSRFYLDKPTRDLSLAEAASLAALPRGPAVYAMTKHPERVVRRRDRILDRMRGAGWITSDEAEAAKREPLAVRVGKGSFGAPHLVALLASEKHEGEVRTTILRDLQREAEQATRATLRPLAHRHVTSAAVVVLDNANGEILAYVGSPDFDDAAHGGQNDGVRARRQPGSTLKPFVYGLAMERLAFTPATLLPDVELHLPVASGVYAPMNYDERFHGPVRLRDALASSLNVPAVWTANEVGVDVLFDRLRAVGFASLEGDPEFYGPALALGDGEVTLLELANAYATIARGGVWRPTFAVRGQSCDARDRVVMPNDVAATLTDILADKGARLGAFGEGSALELPFEVAAKTGTSKGFRDNWTVGFTREVTVAVWVGNFDGSAMEGVSGITGAGPLFHAVMDAAARARPPSAKSAPMRLADDARFARVAVCPLSGGVATRACGHVVHEWISRTRSHAPTACTMHEHVTIDTRNGLRAGHGCPSAFVAERTFERFDAPFAAWATGARRDIAPDSFSPLCPATRDDGSRAGGALRIGYPRDGSRFLFDPDRKAANQAMSIRVDAPAGAPTVDVRVDGKMLARVSAPFVANWQLAMGEHVITAEAGGMEPSEPVHVRVE